MSDLQPHQQRVVSEKFDLDDKIEKLQKFTVSVLWLSLSDAEKQRLILQLHLMNSYSIVLGERIAAFQS